MSSIAIANGIRQRSASRKNMASITEDITLFSILHCSFIFILWVSIQGGRVAKRLARNAKDDGFALYLLRYFWDSYARIDTVTCDVSSDNGYTITLLPRWTAIIITRQNSTQLHAYTHTAHTTWHNRWWLVLEWVTTKEDREHLQFIVSQRLTDGALPAVCSSSSNNNYNTQGLINMDKPCWHNHVFSCACFDVGCS